MFFILNNVNIIRAICDLKNGLPIAIDIKHDLSKSSSKKFYFSLNRIHPQILAEVSGVKVTTPSRRAYLKSEKFEEPSCEEDEIALKLAKMGELEPEVLRVSSLPKAFEGIGINEVESEQFHEFIKNDIFDVRHVSDAPISLKNAVGAEFFVFRTLIGGFEHYVIKIGRPEQDAVKLVRVHSSCYTGDLLASLRCDCREQLQDAIRFIAESKEFHGGYVLYLMQEGRGIGLANKIEAYRMQQLEGLDTVESNLAVGFEPDEREYKMAIRMLQYLKVNDIALLTNNPQKVHDLKELGINVVRMVPTYFHPNPHNSEYLEVKAEKMGHQFKK